MKKPDFPENEEERQKALERYSILDTIEEESYDNLTSLIASICEVPISLVSLLDKDRNFLKSHYGVPFTEDPRERSFCGHTILEDKGFLVVSDALKDPRFSDNPLVTDMGVRFYAGAALTNKEGIHLGALCVFGKEPKILSPHQKQALQQLSKQVMLLMESRLLNINLLKAEKELQERNTELERFAAVTSHDLKSPLNNIVALLSLLKDSASKKLDKEEQSYIEWIEKSATFLSNHITGLLDFYRSDKLLTREKSLVKSEILEKELMTVSISPQNKLRFHSTVDALKINKEVVCQILMNLISNGFKYNESENPTVDVSISEEKGSYYFEVRDNGIGIPVENQERIFDLFETNDAIDRGGRKGTGIGLATVKKLIDKLEGEIKVNSDKGAGTTITCIISRK